MTKELNFDFNLAQGGIADALFKTLQIQNNYTHILYNDWASDFVDLDTIEAIDRDELIFAQRSRSTPPSLMAYVIAKETGLVYIVVRNGSAEASVAAKTFKAAEELMEFAKEIQPLHKPKKKNVFQINFWSLSNGTGASVRRDIDSLKWKNISKNYADSAKKELDVLLSKKWRPSSAGQLILWTGPPGTGKTTALRALANEWKSWCEMNYITDVENFFGSYANYMINVLLDETKNKWKLLILEDAGEFLTQTAKYDASGPALSRFLNVVDGLIGHGLKTMVLVTTNEPIKNLHEAVSRPGRCAANINFENLTAAEAISWVETNNYNPDKFDAIWEAKAGKGINLADLYAQAHGFNKKKVKEPLGFSK